MTARPPSDSQIVIEEEDGGLGLEPPVGFMGSLFGMLEVEAP